MSTDAARVQILSTESHLEILDANAVDSPHPKSGDFFVMERHPPIWSLKKINHPLCVINTGSFQLVKSA